MNAPNESLLTSWALNEAGKGERAGFEKSMKASPELLAEAQATQAFCQFMQIHLQDEAAALTDSQRERVKSYMSLRQPAVMAPYFSQPRKSLQPPAWYRRPSLVLPLSAAAAVIIGFLTTYQKAEPVMQVADTGPLVITAPVATPQPVVRRTVLAPSAGASQNVEARQLGLASAPAASRGTAVPVSLSTSPSNAHINSSTPVSITTYRTPTGEEEATDATTITLTKAGSGTIKLGGVNTYNGTTTITIVDGGTANSVTTIISTNGTLNSGTIVGTPSGRYIGRSIQELGEATKASFTTGSTEAR